MLPTSTWINQYIPKFLYCLDYYSSVFCAPCGLSLRFIWCHLAPENQHYFPGRPHVITSCPPRLACVRTPSGEQTKAKHVIKSSHWSQPVCLSVALCWCYCDIKQTGDLHYSSGLREWLSWKRTPTWMSELFNYSGPPSPSISREPLKRLNGEAEKWCIMCGSCGNPNKLTSNTRYCCCNEVSSVDSRSLMWSLHTQIVSMQMCAWKRSFRKRGVMIDFKLNWSIWL